MPTDANRPVADVTTQYAYKPSLLGAVWQFRLAPDAIEWDGGNRSGRIPYGDIRRLRLSFRPVTMQTYRFLAEIWAVGAPKLQFASSSWRSMVDQERHDAAYSSFVVELHRRLAAAGADATFEGGSPAFLYWPGLVMFGGVSIALAALTVRGLQAQAWVGTAIVAGFLGLFLWQAGTFFQRNRPGAYRPEAVPRRLLPDSGTFRI